MIRVIMIFFLLLTTSSPFFFINSNRPARSYAGQFIITLFIQKVNTIILFYAFSSNFSTLVSLTQSTNTSAAFPRSSGVGKLGAIRILESFGSFPYG